MQIGNYSIELHLHGLLRLDGGSMFGSVPRTLWEKAITPDARNRIQLTTRSLLIRGEGKVILVDVGCGDKWSDKERDIYGIENSPEVTPLPFEEITDVIVTHLHFDHAGGLTKLKADGTPELSFPDARLWIQKRNYELAKQPNMRERASYLANHVKPLSEAKLELIDGTNELFPGITVHPSNGHTAGLQYLEIRDSNTTLYYPSDLVPTAHHLPLPYNMGYDMCTETVLQEKEALLSKALSEDAILVFEHDSETAAVRIEQNLKGHFAVREKISWETPS